jgi:hypothetical protein
MLHTPPRPSLSQRQLPSTPAQPSKKSKAEDAKEVPASAPPKMQKTSKEGSGKPPGRLMGGPGRRMHTLTA